MARIEIWKGDGNAGAHDDGRPIEPESGIQCGNCGQVAGPHERSCGECGERL